MQKPVALITGAGRGIGRAIAEKLAELDYNLVIDDIFNDQDINDTLQSVKIKGADVLYVQADISQTADRKRLIQEIKTKFNRLDVLVNNAGVAPQVRMDILQATEESYDRVMNINLRGPYFLTQFVANWMIEQQKTNPEREFKIINTASMSSYTSSPARGEYCLSKAGVSMMTKLYADRLAEYGILVYEIRPGIIATDMTATVQEKYDKLIAGGLLPLKRWGQPDDIAQAVAGIVLGYFPYSTGQVFEVDGGFHIPRL